MYLANLCRLSSSHRFVLPGLVGFVGVICQKTGKFGCTCVLCRVEIPRVREANCFIGKLRLYSQDATFLYGVVGESLHRRMEARDGQSGAEVRHRLTSTDGRN